MTTTPAAAARPTTTLGHVPIATHTPEKPRVAFKALLLGERKERKALTPSALQQPPPRNRVPAPLGRQLTHDGREPAHGDRERAHREREPAHRDTKHRPDQDVLDPMARHAAQIAPPMLGGPAPIAESVPEVKARASLEELLPQVVKRIAWAGDGRRGSVRMELGAGALAGGTVTVHADDGRVRVEIAAPAGADAGHWRERIEARLAARGIEVERVEVR